MSADIGFKREWWYGQVVHWKGVTKKQFTPYKEHLLEKYGLGIKTIDKIPNRIVISVSNAEVQLECAQKFGDGHD